MKDENLFIGPTHGVDAAVLRVRYKVMAVTEDPNFGLASWGWDKFGWGVVHICAGDMAVLGIKTRPHVHMSPAASGNIEENAGGDMGFNTRSA